jgi:hypothetical protein
MGMVHLFWVWFWVQPEFELNLLVCWTVFRFVIANALHTNQ